MCGIVPASDFNEIIIAHFLSLEERKNNLMDIRLKAKVGRLRVCVVCMYIDKVIYFCEHVVFRYNSNASHVQR